MRRSIRCLLTTAIFALAVSLATTVVAAPTGWEQMDVTRHYGQDGGVLLVSGELPAATTLPAEAELSVPAGSQLQWIGEILGGASSEDPELTYTKTTVGASDIYRFTLTKSRTAQIEVPAPGAQPFDGSTYTSSLTWVATQEVPSVRMNLRVPQAAKIASPSPDAALLPGDSTYSFYSKTFKNVKAGDTLDLAVAYSLPAAGTASTGAAAPAGSNSAVPIMLVLLVLAAFAALIFAVRRKMTGGEPSDEDLGARETDRRTRSRAESSAAETTDADDVDGASDSESPVSGQPMSGRAKRNLVTALIVGALAVAAVVVGMQSTAPKMTGDTISQTFSAGEPCATAKISLAVPDQADPQKTAEALFAAIKPIAGLTTATYNRKTSSIDIGYCDSTSSEAALRQALAPTGMVAAGGAAVAPTP